MRALADPLVATATRIFLNDAALRLYYVIAPGTLPANVDVASAYVAVRLGLAAGVRMVPQKGEFWALEAARDTILEHPHWYDCVLGHERMKGVVV